MKRFKLWLTVVCIAMLSGIILTGCSDGVSQAGSSLGGMEIGEISKSARVYFNRGFISEAARDYGINNLSEDYERWKSTYVVQAEGLPAAYYRVQRDETSNYDTVSEGIGYGLLLAVYFNDQDTFDKIYNYCYTHFIDKNIPLMHWKVDRWNNNISEFGDYSLDYELKIPITGSQDGISYGTTDNAIIPHGKVYGNLKNGTIFIVPFLEKDKDSDPNKRLIAHLESSPDYYAMDTYDRDGSSATDADVDIAAALCFASKAWKGKTRLASSNWGTYAKEATNMITAIRDRDFVDGFGFLKNGNKWGDNRGWNPSYFSPAYYLRVFAAHCPDQYTFWKTAYDRMYAEMYKIKSFVQRGNGANPVFFPDW